MKNILGVSSSFFKYQMGADWKPIIDAGFMGAELCFEGSVSFQQMIDDASIMRRNMLAGGMEPTSAHLPFGPHWDISKSDAEDRKRVVEAFKEVIDIVCEWDIPICVLHGSAEPISDDERQDRLKAALNSIEELYEYAKDMNIRIALENLPRTCLGNVAHEIDYLTRGGEIAGLCFDFNHLMIESHEEFISKVGKHTITTHLSDYDFINERHWFIGDGDIEWKRVVNLLLEEGYEGQFLFELDEGSARDGSLVTPRRLMDRFQDLVNS